MLSLFYTFATFLKWCFQFLIIVYCVRIGEGKNLIGVELQYLNLWKTGILHEYTYAGLECRYFGGYYENGLDCKTVKCPMCLYVYIYIYINVVYREVHSSAISLILAPEEPKAHSNALWLSINPASMKSQGANVQNGANLPVYTISSYTDASVPAPQNCSPRLTCLQGCSCRTKWLYHLGLLFHLCCCFSWNPFQAVSPTTQAKFEKWKKGTMQSGHILQPAVK